MDASSLIEPEIEYDIIDYEPLETDPSAENQHKRVPKRQKKQTPMATLEMILTTKEFQKIEQLPKLPTISNELNCERIELPKAKKAKVQATAKPTQQLAKLPTMPSKQKAVINLPKPLPKCITIKPVTTWKVQAENLRKKVDERLKQNMHVKEIARKLRLPTKNSNNRRNKYFHSALDNHVNPVCLETLKSATQATQTDSNGSDTCGFIKRFSSNKTFLLTCFNCDVEYELSDWQAYMIHYNEAHDFKVKHEDCLPSETAPAAKTQENIAENLANAIEILEMSTFTSSNDDISDLIEEVNEDDDVANDDKASISNCKDNKESSTAQNVAIIDFYTTHTSKVVKFLKVLQTHPILWHPRRYGPITFDKEAEKFLKAYDQPMTSEDLQHSLKKARELLRRFTDTNLLNSKKIELEPQLPKYFDVLYNIAELSKSFTYDCERCSFYFLDESDLYKHKLKKHGIGDISTFCSTCGLYFENAEKRAAHDVEHQTEQPIFNCDHCSLSFFTQKKLDNHIYLNHRDVPGPLKLNYECPKCSEKFARHYLLKWHILKHEPRRYKCETCGKTYQRAFDYKHHLRGHLNQRDFICEECGKGFLAKHALRKHLLTVHKTGTYACAACKSYFANKENLHDHMQKYHPNGTDLDRKQKLHAIHVKRYHNRLKAERRGGLPHRAPNLKCKQCGLEFTRVGELRKHKRELGHYLGDRRYKCPHCESILNSIQTFVMHLRKMHEVPAKYSDIKFYQPYPVCYDENTENAVAKEIEENTKQHAQYVDDDDSYEEVKIAVQNCANYEEVQNTTRQNQDNYMHYRVSS